MPAVSRSPFSPSLPDSVLQATELERNPSVSCLRRLFSDFVDDLLQTSQDSGSGLFANAQNILITGGTFVSRSRRLHKFHIIIHLIFTRPTMSTLSILAKGR